MQNEPVSPGAPGTSWTTGVQTASPVVSPSPPGGGTPETPDPILSAGLSPQDARADDVSASAAGAVAAAQARYHAHEMATHRQGSALGTTLDLPPVPSDYGKATGGANATAYDPAG